MNSNRGIYMGLIVAIIIIVAGVALWAYYQGPTQGLQSYSLNTTSNTQTTENQTETTSGQQATSSSTVTGNDVGLGANGEISAGTPRIVTVNYDGSSFSPRSVSINRGDTVRFVNMSASKMWVASNPHPTHTDYPEFDEKKAVGSGGMYTFTFTKVGTWGYHNHFNPAVRGTVVVE